MNELEQGDGVEEMPALRNALIILEKHIDYNIELSQSHKAISARLDGETPSDKDEKDKIIEAKTIIQDINRITQKLAISNSILGHSLREFTRALGRV